MTPVRPPRLFAGALQGDDPGADDLHLQLALARALEAAGIDGVALADHVLMSAAEPAYPWGRFPVAVDSPFPEPLTLLAAVAAVTERLRLATDVLVVPLRPAALLAKTIATLDRLSGGRLDLAVGVGWHAPEFEASGADFERRGTVLTDSVAAMRALWPGGPTTFDSDTVSFTAMVCAPAPLAGGPTVLFGGKLNRRNLDRIVRLGDGWSVELGLPDEEVAPAVARLRTAWTSGGRLGTPLVRKRLIPGRSSSDQTAARIARLVEDGVTDVIIPVGGYLRAGATLDAAVRDLARTWRSAMDQLGRSARVSSRDADR